MNDKVSYLKEEYRNQAIELDKGALGRKKGGGSEPPEGDPMEARVAALEKSSIDMRDRLVRIEEKVSSVEKHGATKLDLSALESTLIKWFVGTAFAMVGVASAISFGLARLIS